jgi:4-hydroxybenzoate polyprenyltransferase
VAVVSALAGMSAAARSSRSEAGRAAAAVATGQLFVGWSNDYLDRRRDRLAGRTAKPLVRGDVSPRAAAAAALAALGCTVPLSFACGARAGVRHLGAVAAATAYNLGLKRTRWSWVPYACAFSQFPDFVLLSTAPRRRSPTWATVAAALLGTGAHCAQALYDIESDRRVGNAGLPARLGVRRAGALASALPASAVAVVWTAGVVGAHPRQGSIGVRLAHASSASALALSAGVGLAARRHQPLAFCLAMAAALATVPGFLIGIERR